MQPQNFQSTSFVSSFTNSADYCISDDITITENFCHDVVPEEYQRCMSAEAVREALLALSARPPEADNKNRKKIFALIAALSAMALLSYSSESEPGPGAIFAAQDVVQSILIPDI